MGVIVVPVNVLYREREVAHVVADARPRAALTSADRADVFAGAVPVWDAETLRNEAARLASSPVRRLFREMLVWGVSMTVVGAAICQLFASTLAGR